MAPPGGGVLTRRDGARLLAPDDGTHVDVDVDVGVA